jgi:hypothetical protein
MTKLLQRKVEFVNNYITQQQGQKQTEKVKANISTLEQTKQSLLQPLSDYNGKVYWISSVDAIVVFSTEKKSSDFKRFSLKKILTEVVTYNSLPSS